MNYLKHLSYSSLDLFERCPRCWFLKYKLKYEFPSSEALEFGSACHDLVECYHKPNQKLKPETEARLNEIMPYLEQYKLIYDANDYDVVEEFVRVQVEHPEDPNKFLELPLLGKIDRVHCPHIHDLKTSGKDYTQERVDNSKQADLYMYIYYKEYGELPDSVIFDVLIKQGNPRMRIHETEASEWRMKRGLQWIWDLYDKIKKMDASGVVPPEHGANCFDKETMI